MNNARYRGFFSETTSIYRPSSIKLKNSETNETKREMAKWNLLSACDRQQFWLVFSLHF